MPYKYGVVSSIKVDGVWKTNPEYSAKYFSANREHAYALRKVRRLRNPNIRATERDYQQKHRKHLNTLNAAWQRRTRIELWETVLEGYGAKCGCCGESEPVFLTLDHVNGGGRADIEKRGGNRIPFYQSIIKRGFPNEYRILCFNCNCGRARSKSGQCPHEAVKGQL